MDITCLPTFFNSTPKNINKSGPSRGGTAIKRTQKHTKKQLQWILNRATRRAQKKIKQIKQRTLTTARRTIKDTRSRPTTTTSRPQQDQAKHIIKMVKNRDQTQGTSTSRTHTLDTQKRIGTDNSNQGDPEPRLHSQHLHNNTTHPAPGPDPLLTGTFPLHQTRTQEHP